MRRATYILGLALILRARPGTADPNVQDPERWIGDWVGNVKSTFGGDEGCEEVSSTTLKVRFTLILRDDGNVAVTAVGENLPTLLPGGSYAAQSVGGDLLLRDEGPVTVKLRRKGLRLEFDGVSDKRCGGTEQGTLSRRASSGIVECDNLIGARIAAGVCAQFPSDLLPGVPDLKKVARLHGVARTKQRQSCSVTLNATISLLQDRGCVAGTESAARGGTEIPECDNYFKTAEAYGKCEKLSQAAKDALPGAVESMKAVLMSNMTDDAKDAAGKACKSGIKALKDGAKALGCDI